MQKKWIFKNIDDLKLIHRLQDELGINEVLASLLVQRGIKSFDEAKHFFRPSLNDLHNPFLMKGMDEAIIRIQQAIDNKEKVLLYGDYDVDGTTSVAMLFCFFKKYFSMIDYYIPNRYSEGYGISFQGVDYAHKNGCNLMISLDCGITDNRKIEYANKKGIDIVICDHHMPTDILPKACAILNPKQKNCEYPFKELSGCGVGFKLVQAFCIKNKIDEKEYLQLLDFVVVSTAADIVSMTGENRVLAFYGLRKLNENPRLCLRVLMDLIDKKKTYWDISDIVFKIAPRINAAGRMTTGRYAVKLLIANKEGEAIKYREILNTYNIERRNIDANITKEAMQHIESSKILKNKKSIVVHSNTWSKGVVGIVASRLVEQYHKPSIVFSVSGDIATGSARSVEGFDLYATLQECRELLLGFGGHKYAAGLSLNVNNIPAFSECFERLVGKHIKASLLIPKIYVDVELKLSEITSKFYRVLKQMAPFGPDNMCPVFFCKGVVSTEKSKLVGKDSSHLKLEVTESSGEVHFGGIGFGLGEKWKTIGNKNLDMCYSLKMNEFRGKEELQLMVKDMRVSVAEQEEIKT